jgi:hypothetical protein
MIRFISILVFLIAAQNSSAQNGFGFQTQLVFQLGAPVNALGLNTNFFYAHNNFQVATGWQAKLYASGLGPKGMYIENRFHLSGNVSWGNNRAVNRQFMNPIFQFTDKRNSLGYAHYWYWDSRETSQRSGAWLVQIDRAYVYFENDLFAGEGRDRFRTGTLQFMYMDSVQQIGLNMRMWTGETRGAKVIENSTYPSSRGYKDLSESLYGKHSHGILSVSYARSFDFSPINIELGIDDERIRHFFQNKLIHDFPYFLKTNPMRNRHLPMLDENGLPYVDLDTQKLRRTRVFIHGSLGG